MLAPADGAQFIELFAPISSEIVKIMAELQTKIVFRNSYGPVALANVTAQWKAFVEYWIAFDPFLPVGRFAYTTSLYR